MKMLLASNGDFLIKKGYQLLGIPKDEIRIGYVTTASKGTPNDEYIKLHKEMMTEQGLPFEEIDIENKSEEELNQFFSDKNIIHMEGGNGFYLLRAVKKSGFDEILKDLLDKDVIYAGTSAGASIIGPTIEFSSWLPKGATKEEIQALNLVPFLIKAHYTNDKRSEYMERIKNLKYPIRFLRDGQGILVENGKYHFVGEGSEVELKPVGNELNEMRIK